jgi:Co/Zn/Cd efflux system component
VTDSKISPCEQSGQASRSAQSWLFRDRVARAIGSVSLFANSIDFLEDAAVNGLILAALGWSAHRRSIIGMILAAILFAPAVATAWTVWEKFNTPVPPAAMPLSMTGLGALAVKQL